MRRLDEITMQPLLTMAMDEEFYAPADPEFRVHSLAGLMVATYLKGVQTPPEDYETRRIGRSTGVRAFRYSPSWANVEATALAQVDPRIEGLNFLTGLCLRSEGSIIPNLDVVYNIGTSVIQWGEHNPMPLDDRPTAVKVKELLGEDAQKFFENADPLE